MLSYTDFIKENTESKWIYEGNFTVTEDMVHNGEMIKEKIPDIVTGNFVCEYLKLTTLKNCPKKVGKNFLCNSNRLKNLEFCPKKIGGFFKCSNNKLTSLKGCPEKIGGFFSCANNKLTSLEFAPKKGIPNIVISGERIGISVINNIFILEIEKQFIVNGYKDYWLDLLKYCIDNNIDLEAVKGWPEGFLNSNTVQSVKGISKFDL